MSFRRALLCLIAGLILGVALNAATGSSAPRHRVLHTRNSPLLAAIVRTDAWPLHHGTTFALDSRGPRVATLQYLIRDPRPAQNVFTKVKGTLKPLTFSRGIYDLATARAVIAYKFRIGYPARGQCGARASEWRVTKVGPYFFELLQGRKQRPACWVAVASKRLQTAEAGVTQLALQIKALELSQLGVSETWGSNWGPQISVYQAVTGAYRQPWCASFQQWAFLHGGYGTFANRSAYVPYIIEWARAHGYLNAKAKAGALVAYYGNRSHIGLVAKVTASGFVDLSGNYNNRVAEVFHQWGTSLQYFIWLPKVVG